MKCACGSVWFLEERLVRPAGLPQSPQHNPMPNAEMPRYRYRCCECGLLFGQERPAEVKPAVVEAENEQPKRRGRPPKAAQTK